MVFDKKKQDNKNNLEKCKKERVCMVCEDAFHGLCERKEKCVNCKKKNRRANDRKCYYFQKRIEENKLRAEERTSKQESRRTIEENRDLTRRENKGTKKFWGKGNERTGEGRMDLINDKENLNMIVRRGR